ncbi:hypothetical protein [Roseobacter ponti]|uniref:hypothetical protein n=1 Tax=Roseobacter ponti TaxID=1891787 RepID=UPI00197F3FF1|nr:hypothetical protein [Roseobacter ponti]
MLNFPAIALQNEFIDYKPGVNFERCKGEPPDPDRLGPEELEQIRAEIYCQKYLRLGPVFTCFDYTDGLDGSVSSISAVLASQV